MTNSRLQVFPSNLLEYYEQLLEEIDKLRSHYKSFLDMAIIDRHYGMTSDFLRQIQKKLKIVRQICRHIRRQYTVTGRPPKWYSIINDTSISADDLADGLRTIKQKISENRWIEVEAWVRKSIKECETITRALEKITLPSGLQLFRDELKDVDMSLD